MRLHYVLILMLNNIEQLKKRDQLLEAEIEKLERPTTIGAKPKENAQLVLKDRKELLMYAYNIYYYIYIYIQQ